MKTSYDQPFLPGMDSYNEPVPLFGNKSSPKKRFVVGEKVDLDFRITVSVFKAPGCRIFIGEAEGYRPVSIKVTGDEPIELGWTIHVVGVVGRYRTDETITATRVFCKKARREGIIQYLSTNFPGIGKTTAEQIYNTFGEESLDVVVNYPEKLKAVPGIGKTKSSSFINAARDSAEKRETMVYLGQLGVTPGYARMIWDRFGDRARKAIEKNPYILTQVAGIGFRRADEIAMRTGISKTDPERLHEGLLYALEYECTRSGHCYLNENTVIKRATEILDVDPSAEMDWMKNCPRVKFEDGRIFPRRLWKDEYDIAAMLRRLTAKGCRDIKPVRSEMKLSLDQVGAIMTALSQKVCVITGGPGSGKTTVVDIIARSFYRKGFEIALASPTGRAAKRLEEVSGFPAKTIHRLLQVDRNGVFRKNIHDQLDADVVIIDESSMIDVSLGASLLRAIRSYTRVIFVGDSDQLPSVGPGNFLRDMIASGKIPVARLTHIHRQKEGSRIASVSANVRNGIPFGPSRDGEFCFFDYTDAARLSADLNEKILSLRGSDFQVLSPMHDGMFGTVNLNRTFQALLNPAKPGLREIVSGENVFRVGDKVMQERNDYDLDVMNGSVGVIRSIGDSALYIDFGEVVEYPRDRISNLSLAYAVTIHKSQGSEYENVVLVLFGVTPIMYERNMLYTGMTRAKKHLFVYGARHEVVTCTQRSRADARHTNLKNLLEMFE
jgi:exodeoxyribonuclease V alpha subunit